MKIEPTQSAPRTPVAPVTFPGAAKQAAVPGAPWQNPAAAAALVSSSELLKSIEDGVISNYGDVERVRTFATDLRATNEILASASDTLLGDSSAENDQFIPLVNRASTGVGAAELRLSSKDLTATWPAERDDIISAIRQARVLSFNIARQLGGGN